ncbi:mediator of RNA polymerase II transcription subunit 15-like [Penaeus japonicus]|uniref:mediator of RNA polymerase II transcription subunit 15-like n=1 Tax=Penaeus japonicus TaxID=27405 RepID=UPI001C713185|nr:mediator of RNA polymerase II transcription subunit 15-like [Penaeus japonicus]
MSTCNKDQIALARRLCATARVTIGVKNGGRRRQRLFKLKFHHQALPPEYLDHYEASLRQEQRAAAAASANSSPVCTPTTARHPREALGPEAAPVRDPSEGGLQGGVPRPGRGGRGRGRAQRNSRPITIHEAGAGATEALLRDLLTRPHLQQAALQHVALARAQSVPSIMLASQQGARSPPSPGAAGQEEQLPYMGEMLLDARPRRGRKPKKADITHLISKNYGGGGLHGAGMGVAGAMHEQVAMQHPDYSLHHLQQQLEQQQQQQQEQEDAARRYSPMEHESLARSRSYSLLQSALAAAEAQDQSEPLNLCVRDRPFKCEPEQAQARGQPDLPRIKLEPPSVIEEEEASRAGEMGSPDGVGWAAGGRLGVPAHWLHDYRLKSEDGLSSGQSTPSLCSQSSHMPSLSPPAFPHMSPPPPLASPRMRLSPHLMACPQSPHSPSPVPPASPLPPGHHHRHVHALLKESLQQRLEEAARERLSPQETLLKERGRGGSARGAGGGARRKRSALFIPPADPSTEVSICKFKFTGGPNPILEEKKMVSVDAGGTLRYFSGGERGVARDSRAAAAHVKLSGKLLDNITKCETDVKKIRLESDTEDTCSLSGRGSTTTSPVGTLERGMQPPMLAPPMEDSPKRKRRSKKSSVREKLEQTLRERGLLIQTQQVESAEGATYCKFRQLRKFTRYLFRSWKDYLPGQLQEGGVPLDGYSDPRHPAFPHHLARGPPTPDHR